MMFESEVVTDRSGLHYRALVPTEAAWGDSRVVLCVLYDAEGDRMTDSFVIVE